MNFIKPKFWDLRKPNFISKLLVIFTLPLIINNFLLNIRPKKKNHKIKTICVGNIYLGGTGKTPATIRLYKIFTKLGLKVAVGKKFYNSHLDEISLLTNETSLITDTNRNDIISKTLTEKKRGKTRLILSRQIRLGLNKIKKKSNILIAYEPVWSIGTGNIPKPKELEQTVNFIKKKFKGKSPKILYGGSVNPQNISDLKKINTLDGFLIGGASQSPKKFIDIVKKTYN